METETQERTQLARVVEESRISAESARVLVAAFKPLLESAEGLLAEADAIRVTDATQLAEMRQAREKRLALRKVRLEVENNRKTYKEDSLRMGRAIDDIARNIRARIEPTEARLEEEEKFAERAEAKRKTELRASRAKVLAPFGVDPRHYRLEDMSEAEFSQLFDSSRLAHEARVAEAARVERERIEAEERQRAEDARIREENRRLARERAEVEAQARADRAQAERERQAADAAARAEREKIEAQARQERIASEARERAEREAREKAEAELRAKQEAEARAAEEAEKERRRAELAPDREKVIAYAAAIRAVPLPTLSDKAADVRGALEDERDACAKWIEDQAGNLQ